MPQYLADVVLAQPPVTIQLALERIQASVTLDRRPRNRGVDAAIPTEAQPAFQFIPARDNILPRTLFQIS